MRVAVIAFLLIVALPLAAQERVPTARDSVMANVRIAWSDLRNLVVAQEAYFADHGKYSSNLDSLRYVPTRGSTIAFIITRNDAWSASLKRDRLVGSCIMFVNLSESDRPKTAAASLTPEEGVPLCDEQPELRDAASTPSTTRPPR